MSFDLVEMRSTLIAGRARARALGRSERSERDRGWYAGYVAASSDVLAMLDTVIGVGEPELSASDPLRSETEASA